MQVAGLSTFLSYRFFRGNTPCHKTLVPPTSYRSHVLGKDCAFEVVQTRLIIIMYSSSDVERTVSTTFSVHTVNNGALYTENCFEEVRIKSEVVTVKFQTCYQDDIDV